MRNLFVAWLLFAVVASHAEYLSDYQVKQVQPPASLVWGGGYTGRMFAGGVDHWLSGQARWRMDRHWGCQGETSLDLSQSGYIVSLQGHWLPKGNLFTDGYEDFVHAGLGYAWGPVASAPLISLGFGRDVLPWTSATFGMRLAARIEYAFGDKVFTREKKGVFGITENKLARTLFGFAVEAFFL